METTESTRVAVLSAVALCAMLWTAQLWAATESFRVALSPVRPLGAQPPQAVTAGTGTADLTFDPATRVLTWSITYSGLSGPITMAHVQQDPQGRDGPVVLWLSRHNRPVSNPIVGRATLSPEQAMQFAAGNWFINLHTQAHPAGEIRGQAVPPGGSPGAHQ